MLIKVYFSFVTGYSIYSTFVSIHINLLYMILYIYETYKFDVLYYFHRSRKGHVS